jgi:hypothetical protein
MKPTPQDHQLEPEPASGHSAEIRHCSCDRIPAMTYNNLVESSSHDRVAVAILRLRRSFS